jgi:hypothetical protein
MAVGEVRDGGGTSVLTERARSEGARPTRAVEVTPSIPSESGGKNRSKCSFDGRGRDYPGCET